MESQKTARDDAPGKDAGSRARRSNSRRRADPGLRRSPSEGTVATTHPLSSASTGSLPRRLREAALVGRLALTLTLAGNARISLWDRDEPRYAGCTREMRARGDWLVPTFNAEPRYHKPVLIYWLMMAGTALGGDNPFGARLVSALAGTGTCLVILAWGRRMLGDRVGLWAAL